MLKGLMKRNGILRLPRYGPMARRVEAICYAPRGGETEWYPPVMEGAPALAEKIVTGKYVERARELLTGLSPDAYSSYMVRYYSEGLERFGDRWRYADIVTVLLALSERLRPAWYLEIGVRRGRSACAVASAYPEANLVLCDMWIRNYAAMENPGPDFVRAELQRVAHAGSCEFVEGNSHETLPKYFQKHPAAVFDLITVDGDHSDDGAAQDLCDVLPRLAVGGAIVFDDIAHPQHPGLRDVWDRLVARDPRFSVFLFEEVGYGVGFAIRKW